MKRILITGGPVYAKLDDVKIITNVFKGGLMAELAYNFAVSYMRSWNSKDDTVQVIYLCSKLAKNPGELTNLTIINHNGFEDYRQKVLDLAPKMDAVILGAAVANLIPWKPFVGKFPSHNYEVGEPIPILFKIAPRIINEIKKVAPRTYLFGFKLLNKVSEEELIKAAYLTLRESKATAVFANDKSNLKNIKIVTKERAVHSIDRNRIIDWVWKLIHDKYYKSINVEGSISDKDKSKIESIVEANRANFVRTEDGFLFGTIAVRSSSGNGFITTGRAKNELSSFVYVSKVDHDSLEVYVHGGRATLNAPLLDWIFRKFDQVETIMHFHNKRNDFPTLFYAPPGTVRDSQREIITSFNIKNHGCFILLNRDCVVI